MNPFVVELTTSLKAVPAAFVNVRPEPEPEDICEGFFNNSKAEFVAPTLIVTDVAALFVVFPQTLTTSNLSAVVLRLEKLIVTFVA